MESYISFKWKSLDIILSQGKVGPFRILSEKQSKKQSGNRKAKELVCCLPISGKCSFFTPLKNGRNPLVFPMCPWGKERKYWPKMG